MTIKRRTLFLTLGLPSLLPGARAIEPAEAKADWLAKAGVGFSMLYYLGEVTTTDEVRMVDEKDMISREKTGRKVPTAFLGLLAAGGIDVAALVARAGKRAGVSNEFLQRFLDALLVPDSSRLAAMCYRPHHVIVCYTPHGIPVAALEVCLECFGWDSLPRIPRSKSGDYLAVAKLIDSLKIPLGPDFPNLKSYEERCAERDRGGK